MQKQYFFLIINTHLIIQHLYFKIRFLVLSIIIHFFFFFFKRMDNMVNEYNINLI